MTILKRHCLEHPLTRGLSVDDPQTTALRRTIIKEKTFLRALYSEWYMRLVTALPKKGAVLELGSGAGFFADFRDEVITSDIFPTPSSQLVVDACRLPFLDDELVGIVMTDVFHHIPDIKSFLNEATRCIRPGGKILMIEPWRTNWSQWVYTRLHSEPFVPSAGWDIPLSGPLTGANGALPWIVFERDRKIFEDNYPDWRIVNIEPMMPFCYLASGGISYRSFMPGWTYGLMRRQEQRFDQKRWAMFAFIELKLRS
jgi:SAM-dependent methyltransferase